MIPKIKSVPFTSVKLKDAFWLPRIAKHKIALNDCLDICEQTGRINNFRVAGKLIEGKHVGIFFNDSDVYKIIEGIAYYIQINPDAELERRADEIIRAICSSQMPDGYVNTYFTLVKPEERWTDMEMHETYCAGHMVEGALAYLQATGKSAFYDAALRFVDHIYETFFIPNRPWVTGHQEIELALFKLYRHTGNEKHRLLAQFFLDWRGRSLGVGGIRAAGCESPAYCQDDVPAENLRNVGGHAVRAMYMYTAMTDAMASSADGGKYAEALDSLWDSVVNKNMYITGGIGSTASNEGFSGDFDLPNDSAYCETCASFGLAMWSRQMFLCKGKSVYADIMEKTMYNSLLAGVSLSGNKYFYVNPLSSPGSHHRQPWHDCACCPSQVARFMPSVGGYIYAHDKSDVYINLFVSSEAKIIFDNGSRAIIEQSSGYPFDGSVDITVSEWSGGGSLFIRLPEWCGSYLIEKNKNNVETHVRNGYLKISNVRSGDQIHFCMDMPAKIIFDKPQVKANEGKACVTRGPLVYCIEEADNPEYVPLLYATEKIKSEIYHGGSLFPDRTVFLRTKDCLMIPYCFWDNRAPGKMDCWLDCH